AAVQARRSPASGGRAASRRPPFPRWPPMPARPSPPIPRDVQTLSGGSPSRSGTSLRRRQRARACFRSVRDASWGSSFHRKFEFHRSALANASAIRTDASSVLLDERLADRQTESDAVSDVLSREKRLEHVWEVLCGDAAASIGHA